MNATVLSQMLAQFRQRHRRLPEKIVVTPLALLALAARGCATTRFEGVPVLSREVDVAESASGHEARNLCVFLRPKGGTGAELVCCDLK
jgi:hypothetical protein